MTALNWPVFRGTATARPDVYALPAALVCACRRQAVTPSRDVLIAQLRTQTLWLLSKRPGFQSAGQFPPYELIKRFVISSSRFGSGQASGSHRTPLGLHRIAEKVGAGWPVGAAFTSRQFTGYTWHGKPAAPIAHRILWLDGLEPGHNRGGTVDTHARYVYIHGLADEPTLGRPASRGCLHLAAKDLLPLFDRVPTGTLVWITVN